MSNSSGASAGSGASDVRGARAAVAPEAEIVAVHEGADGWGVVTVRSPAGD
ncbi:hypothetical protein [Actinophytocola glycyrrhizae]|uniref:Uncharacterized protein n=1 Tax=Actinophytocola glycyrrhizae TaxID=2044873 RepID=A0ABV9SFH6_9PSEU